MFKLSTVCPTLKTRTQKVAGRQLPARGPGVRCIQFQNVRPNTGYSLLSSAVLSNTLLYLKQPNRMHGICLLQNNVSISVRLDNDASRSHLIHIKQMFQI